MRRLKVFGLQFQAEEFWSSPATGIAQKHIAAAMDFLLETV
ncbi:MAG: hypothetical protein Q8R13_02075 [bacterium]|nr:hypothetical protein [bacterium]MDZ4296016.1 hypothetical protein [Patescibacteria group bacterium]